VSGGLARLKILVVDDVAMIRDIMRAVLGTLGVQQIRVAKDGGDGLAAAHSWQPDIIFSDWQMKPMDGIEFVRRMRQDASPNPYVPIIMLTSHCERDRVIEARDAGVNEFLAKPFTATTVMSHLKSVISQPRNFVRTPVYFGPDRRRDATAVAADRRVAGKAA
jgi:two-component system chemotaxis response regulator CheY